VSRVSAVRRSIGVVRVGRLGDLVMTLPALDALVAAGVDTTLVTDEHHAPLMGALLPDVRVATPSAGGTFDVLLDLHRTASARRASRAFRAPITVRVEKDSLERRGLLRNPWDRPLALLPRRGRTWPERHLDAARRLLARWDHLMPAMSPVPSRPRPPGSGRALGMVIGARHPLKQWSVSAWQALAHAWRREGGTDVLVIAAPWERERAEAIDEEVASPPLLGLPRVLGRCAVVVSGDTGPLHLAGAFGIPTVGLFGPTPVDAGFWVWGERSRALTVDVGCRPCSLHGAARCRRGRRDCLDDLDPAHVARVARRLAAPRLERVS